MILPVQHDDQLTPAIESLDAQMLATGVRFEKNKPWSNWGVTAHCRPQFSVYPTSVADLSKIVQLAQRTGKQIRVVAQGHAWSALVPTADILVYIQQLNQVRMDNSDATAPKVVIEAGATVQAVNDLLEAHGYALPFNVVLESVCYGGLIATGSHGSGWENPTLSDLVYAIEIVTANGDLRKFTAGVDRVEVMNAARLHLGMFGITYRITLHVQKSWRVRAVDQRLPVVATLANLQELVLAHENLDLFWWPFCQEFWVKSWDRTEAAMTAKPRASRRDRWWAWISGQLFNGSLRLARRWPCWTPTLSRLSFRFTPSVRDQVVDVVEAIHYRRSIEVNKMGCMEIAFRIDPTFAQVRQAIQVVFDKTDAYAARHEYPFNVTMNVRFTRNSACWLSPAFGEGHTCFIEILSYMDQAAWHGFAANVASEWLKLPGAKPHWAKEFAHIPGVIQHIKTVQAANIAHFNRIKAELQVDPTDIFVNDLLRQIFTKHA